MKWTRFLTQRLLAVMAISSIVIYAFIYSGLLLDFRSDSISRDFSIYYTSASMILDGAGHRLYDLALQREYFPQPLKLFLPFNHPAFEAIVYLPFGLMSFQSAFYIWMIFSIFLCLVCVKLVSKLYMQQNESSENLGGDIFLLLLLLASIPVWAVFINGQNSLLFVVVLLIALSFHYQKRYFVCGIVMAWLLIKPQLGIPLMISILFRSDRRMFYGLGVGCLFWAGMTLGILRYEGWISLFEMIRELSQKQTAYNMHYGQMSNLTGLLTRLPLPGGANLWKLFSIGAWALILPVIGLMSVQFRRHVPQPDPREEWRLDVQIFLLASLFSVHMYAHDMVLFALANLILLQQVFKSLHGGHENQKSRGIWIPVTLGLACLIFISPMGIHFLIYNQTALVLLQVLLLAGSAKLAR